MSEKDHTQLGLTDTDVREMYRYMLLARKVDERIWLLNRAGKIPFVISCQGQEALQAGAGFAMDRKIDYLCPYYRDHALVMIFGQTAKDFLLSFFARAEDPNSGGRQMPGHFGDRRFRILSGSSPVGTQLPHATGIALAAKLEKKPIVSLVTFGEGTSNQGDFHEACNFAGVHKLPVIFLCENNGYAISVPLKKQLACKSVADRAQGYGFPGVTIDGNDPLVVYEAVKQAAERARRGEGPTLIDAKTYRLVPHSSDDDDSDYRTREEVQAAKERDPLVTFAKYLRSCGVLTDDLEHDMTESIQQEVDEATRYAESAKDPEPDSLFKYVYEAD